MAHQEAMLDGLNAAQRSAVTSPANVLQILAPPGSGKTKTLTSRVAYLLRHHDYKPWNMICLTFTIKSSKEMRERIARLVGDGVEKKLILGTFHSVCRRYLVAYGHLIGISKDFGIADSSDQISIIKRTRKRLGLGIDPKIAQSRISNAKSKGLSHHDLAQRLLSKKDVEQQEVVVLFEAYEAHLATSNLLDYDDLLLRCAYLLKAYPSCVSNVEVVLVDEFQDTNVVQFDLLRLFAAQRNRITTVGDPDQSIYGWRSADVKNLKKMQSQYPDTLVVRLEDNYRSSGAILLAAQEIIEQDESRPQKSILPTHCLGTVPVLRKLPSAAVEAEWIVSEIQRTRSLTGHLLAYSDFAILLRSAALSRLIESAMGKASIPYRMVGGQRFYDRAEIRVLLDYLRIVSQPSNNDALVRVVNVPARGIGSATVKNLLEEAERKGEPLWTLIRSSMMGSKSLGTKVSKAAEQGLSTFVSIIMTTRAKLLNVDDRSSPEELLRHIIKRLDFQTYLEKIYAEDHEGRWANVEELVAQASEYNVASPEDGLHGEEDDNLPSIDGVEQERGGAAEEALSKFLANVALAAAVDVTKEDETENDETDSQVTISTIHAAKGLEWAVVFIPSAYEGIIPHSRAEDNDEERRLLYVAMTRAQALLYMSCPMKSSQREDTKMSSFLSTKKVGRLLSNQGPKIKVSDVVNIACILRRELPSEADIEEGTSHLENALDDRWPLTGEESIAAIQKGWRKREDYEFGQTEQRGFKKPRTMNGLGESSGSYIVSRSTTTIGSTITMNNPAAFSYQGSAGFSTAAKQLEIAREAKAIQKEAILPKKLAKDVTAVNGKEEATILSLWGMKGRGEPKRKTLHLPETARSEIVTVHSSTSLLQDQRENALPRKPLATIPQDLSSHRLNPLIKKPPPSEYVFLSSSPPPAEPEPDQVSAPDPGDPILTANPHPSSDKLATDLTQKPSTLAKKTLGVRRNMNGWSASSGRGFKTPVIAPK